MHLLRSDEKTVMEVAAPVIVGKQSIAKVSEDFGLPYATVKRWVAAVTGDHDALHRYTHDIANADESYRAMLHLAVELGVIGTAQRNAALVSLVGGNHKPSRDILDKLAQATGGMSALLRRLTEDEDLLERADAIDFT